MSNQFKETWEKYVSSWKIEASTDKKAIFEECLDSLCEYNDPLTKTKGWDELIEYMRNFQEQIPGGYFSTTYFMAHNNKSIAKWQMKNAEGIVLGDGISFGEYNGNGKLISITGFYETPDSQG